MNKDVFEWYDTFIIEECTYELKIRDFKDQPIPFEYYNFINDDNDNVKNIPSNYVGDALPDNELMEYAVVPNDEDINYEKIMDVGNSLALNIDPLKTKFWSLKEWTLKIKEGKLKEWRQQLNKLYS